MMSLHLDNTYAKKRGIADNLLLGVPNVMYQHQVDLVACDFKWCRMVPPVGQRISTHQQY